MNASFPIQRNAWLTPLLVAIALFAGCGEQDFSQETSPDDEPAQTAERQLGEPDDGYPSYEERAVLYLTNRARTEPDAFNEDDPYDPRPPLAYDHDLARAARWQAEHIIERDCWCSDHSSCCEMEAADEGGRCAGPSDSCGATAPDERVGYWSNDYSGENAAQGQQSAEQVLESWINSPGHWQNINGAHTQLGPGHHEGGWVQVFGRAAQPPVAGDGIHMSDSNQTSFGTTYYQPDTGGPREIMAVVEGECHDLELAYGEADHGAYEASVPLDSGCHRYYFHVTDGEGNEHTYPSQGSLGAAVGDADDCKLYSENRPADSCSPSGEDCETGQTRTCYTGPAGTRNVGICSAGTQRCVGGEWDDECRNVQLPDSEETCDNDRDDDCDGQVDEGCGDENDDNDGSGDDEAESSPDEGCASAGGSDPAGGAVPFVVLLTALLGACRRRARSTSPA